MTGTRSATALRASLQCLVHWGFSLVNLQATLSVFRKFHAPPLKEADAHSSRAVFLVEQAWGTREPIVAADKEPQCRFVVPSKQILESERAVV